MLKILSLCTCVALLLPNIADADIFTWESNGHSYELVDMGLVTWEQARDHASEMGGYLATPTSEAENDWIFNTFDLNDYSAYWHTPSGTGPALGGFWSSSEQQWEWITGETWSYENWTDGQDAPNPAGVDWGMSYSTLEGVPTPSSLWQHVPFNDPGPAVIYHETFIVEWDEIPTPGALVLLGLAGLRSRRRS